MYCISESLDQEKLQELIRIKHPSEYGSLAYRAFGGAYRA